MMEYRETEALATIRQEAALAAEQLLEQARLTRGSLVVVGCSSSEIGAEKIGTHSSGEIGQAVFLGIWGVLKEHGLYLAAQCCEHLNRALIVEREAAEKYGLEEVNVIPWLKGGGSFATAAYQGLADPVAVERVQAAAGIDIGDTLIGMHLRRVAVPVRTAQKNVGAARVVCARTRPKFVGGERARYNEALL